MPQEDIHNTLLERLSNVLVEATLAQVVIQGAKDEAVDKIKDRLIKLVDEINKKTEIDCDSITRPFG